MTAEASPRSRLQLRDLFDEAFAGLFARPARAGLTALGTVLGVAALVATLGLTRTASNQIVTRFDALAATEVVVRPSATELSAGSARISSTIPWDAQDRLERLNGVVAAGTRTDLDVGDALVRSLPVDDPAGAVALPVVAASPGLFPAVRAELGAGRLFDLGHDARGDRVAVLGRSAAQRLGISRVEAQPAVFVGEEAFTVVGIVDDVARQIDLLDAVIIPDGTARERFGLAAPGEVRIEVEPGAARLIGQQAPIALDPNEPSRLRAQTPPEPVAARAAVAEDTQALFLALGGVSLLVGALGIANVTLVAVLERIGEIGLRRALGACRRHVAAQFLVESVLLGAFGGLLGASVGVLVVVGVSAFKTWTPTMQPWLPLAAPLAGALVGLLAGGYPALKAASVEPITALRQSI